MLTGHYDKIPFSTAISFYTVVESSIILILVILTIIGFSLEKKRLLIPYMVWQVIQVPFFVVNGVILVGLKTANATTIILSKNETYITYPNSRIASSKQQYNIILSLMWSNFVIRYIFRVVFGLVCLHIFHEEYYCYRGKED